MSIVWSILSGGITALGIFLYNKKLDKKKPAEQKIPVLYNSIIIGILVFSHWVLDFIGWPMTAFDPSSNYKVPLFFSDSPAIGLGVYSTKFGALFMDIGVFVVGLVFYIIWLVKAIKIRKTSKLS